MKKGISTRRSPPPVKPEQWLDRSEFRKLRREPRIQKLMELRDEGFSIEQISTYQFRVNDRLDYFPTNDKYHDLTTGKRGEIRGKWGNRGVEWIRNFFQLKS
jgi:hypothetical protein